MTRHMLFSGGLGLLTLAVLLADRPDVAVLQTTIWLFFAVLVGLLLNMGTALTEGMVSSAPTGALMAYLTMGEDQSTAGVMWSVALGMLLGNVIWVARNRPTGWSYSVYRRVARGIMVSTAQVTLGLFVGGWAYQQLGGKLPLDRLERPDTLPLAGFVAIYLAVYLGILLTQARLYVRHHPRVVTQSWQALGGIILLPLPFAVLGAVAYHELSQLAFSLLIVGLLIVVGGVHLIGQAQARYGVQVLELSALSVISQAMRTNMDLNALLEVVYQ
jgi:hypothetical protein